MKAPSKNTVFFDLGNVLIFFSHEKMFHQLAKCTGLSLPVLKMFLKDAQWLENYEQGSLTTEQLYHNLQTLGSRSFSLLEMTDALSDIFTPNTALLPIVQQLKEQGTRLVLISNTNECHFNYAHSHYPVLKLFDHYVLSYEVRACKPDPLIFEHALKQAQGQAFYTDDIPAFVQAGRAAGLDAEVFIDEVALRRDLTERGIF